MVEFTGQSIKYEHIVKEFKMYGLYTELYDTYLLYQYNMRLLDILSIMCMSFSTCVH